MLKDGLKEYLAVAEKDDPLLRLLTPRLLGQRGEDPSHNTEEKRQEILDGLIDAPWLQRKNPKVSPTKWGTYHTSMEFLMPQWHDKLLPALPAGIKQGWATADKVSRYLQQLRSVDVKNFKQKQEDARVTVKEAGGKGPAPPRFLQGLRAPGHLLCDVGSRLPQGHPAHRV